MKYNTSQNKTIKSFFNLPYDFERHEERTEHQAGESKPDSAALCEEVEETIKRQTKTPDKPRFTEKAEAQAIAT